MKIKIIILLSAIILFESCQKQAPAQTNANENITYLDGYDFSFSNETGSESGLSLDGKTSLKVILDKNYKLLSITDINLDIDTLDEQVLICKNLSDPEATLIIMVVDYDEIRNQYFISWKASTQAFSQRTFELDTDDIVGDYNKELILTGTNDKGEITLDVYRKTPSLTNPGINFSPICQLNSDGTIKILQVERSLNYASRQKTGESFPIILEKKDPDKQDSLSLIREQYDWIYTSNQYKLTSSAPIQSEIIEQKRLRELYANYNENAFDPFLEGPWYSKKYGISRMIMFSRMDNQIIFFDNNVQEIYLWELSKRTVYNGLVAYTTNLNMRSIRNHISIRINTINSIYITANDTDWNGEYLKVNEDLQETLYYMDHVNVQPADILLTDMFRTTMDQSESDSYIIFEPPYFTWVKNDDTTISGSFSLINNIPILNSFFLKKELQNLPLKIEKDIYINEIYHPTKLRDDKALLESCYSLNPERSYYLLKSDITEAEKTQLWTILINHKYNGIEKYNIYILTLEIQNTHEDIENYILEYLERSEKDRTVKTIALSHGNLFSNGFEVTSKEPMLYFQEIY
ncbi:MAG: pallilysin-related adhesin [Spirochaetales bacterium]|nr:pallilysin-related adhesin [Spirochaetales bacterium]